MNSHSDAVIAFMYLPGIWMILRNLGGAGLVLVGLTDGAVIPAPGAIDALTILLSARHHEHWLYYAAMAAVGSVVGGSLTYRFGSIHGQAALIKRIGPIRTHKLSMLFAKWGFCAIVIPAMLPVPVSPFLLMAGAMRYPGKLFLAALACGRSVKFIGLAYLASFYGRAILTDTLSQYEGVFFWIAVGVIAGSVVLYRITAHLESDRSMTEESVDRAYSMGDVTEN